MEIGGWRTIQILRNRKDTFRAIMWLWLMNWTHRSKLNLYSCIDSAAERNFWPGAGNTNKYPSRAIEKKSVAEDQKSLFRYTRGITPKRVASLRGSFPHQLKKRCSGGEPLAKLLSDLTGPRSILQISRTRDERVATLPTDPNKNCRGLGIFIPPTPLNDYEHW